MAAPILAYLTPNMISRFWTGVALGELNECWPWLRRKNDAGYGIFNIHGAPTLAHRVSLAISRNIDPDEFFVCHNCPGKDNPSCVNPLHLWLGTAADNAADAARKRPIERVDADSPNQRESKAKWRNKPGFREFRVID